MRNSRATPHLATAAGLVYDLQGVLLSRWSVKDQEAPELLSLWIQKHTLTWTSHISVCQTPGEAHVSPLTSPHTPSPRQSFHLRSPFQPGTCRWWWRTKRTDSHSLPGGKKRQRVCVLLGCSARASTGVSACAAPCDDPESHTEEQKLLCSRGSVQVNVLNKHAMTGL